MVANDILIFYVIINQVDLQYSLIIRLAGIELEL